MAKKLDKVASPTRTIHGIQTNSEPLITQGVNISTPMKSKALDPAPSDFSPMFEDTLSTIPSLPSPIIMSANISMCNTPKRSKENSTTGWLLIVNIIMCECYVFTTVL